MKKLIFLTLIIFSVLIVSTAQADFLTDFNPHQFQKVHVKSVISANAFILDNDQEVLLIGLRAPDLPEEKRVERDQFGFVIKESDPTLSIENQAFDFTRSLLEDKTVRLEFDQEKYGKHNVLMAYVFLIDDNTFVNAEILRQGFAYLSLRPPNMKYKVELRNAYKEARQEKRGLQTE